MRTTGVLDGPAAVGDADHVCWPYDDDRSFEQAAVRFLDAGLERGDRLIWIGDGAEARLRRASGPLSAVDELVARGALELVSVRDGYEGGRPFSPAEQYTFFDRRTRAALADGYAGLRVVAEVTALAGDPAHAADFLRWEHLADDYVDHGPGFRALCAYRRADVPAAVVADAAALHPVSARHRASPDFHIWFDDGRLALSGEVDTAAAGRLRRLLGETHADSAVLTLDLSRVGFMDLAAVREVARFAHSVGGRGARLEIAGSSRLFRRMWQVLGCGARAGVSFREDRP